MFVTDGTPTGNLATPIPEASVEEQVRAGQVAALEALMRRFSHIADCQTDPAVANIWQKAAQHARTEARLVRNTA